MARRNDQARRRSLQLATRKRGMGRPSKRTETLNARRFPPPWTVEDVGGSFVVKASNDRPLIFISYGEGIGRRSLARLLTRNAARLIAAGVAKPPGVLRRRGYGPGPLSAFGGKAGSRRSGGGV